MKSYLKFVSFEPASVDGHPDVLVVERTHQPHWFARIFLRRRPVVEVIRYAGPQGGWKEATSLENVDAFISSATATGRSADEQRELLYMWTQHALAHIGSRVFSVLSKKLKGVEDGKQRFLDE